MDVSAVINVLIITLLSLVSFVGARLFSIMDKQNKALIDLIKTIHLIDKRVTIIEAKAEEKKEQKSRLKKEQKKIEIL